MPRRGLQLARNFFYGRLNWLLRVRAAFESGICPICREHSLAWGICPLYWAAERRRQEGVLDDEFLWALNGDPRLYYTELLAAARSDRVRFSQLVELVLLVVGIPLRIHRLPISFIHTFFTVSGLVRRVEYFVFNTRIMTLALAQPERAVRIPRTSVLESADEFAARLKADKRSKRRAEVLRLKMLKENRERARRELAETPEDAVRRILASQVVRDPVAAVRIQARLPRVASDSRCESLSGTECYIQVGWRDEVFIELACRAHARYLLLPNLSQVAYGRYTRWQTQGGIWTVWFVDNPGPSGQ